MRAAIAGIGIAGVLVFAPGAEAGDRERGSSASGGQESGARGSGMAGSSTGARPGEVTGAQGAPAEAGTSAKEGRAEAKAQDEIDGTVEKYDRATRTLSLSNSEKKLKLTDDTQVFKDGNRVSPGQIMEGDEVRASFSGSGDSLEAARIDVIGSGAATGGADPSKPESAPKGGSPKGTAAGSSSETGSGSTGTKQAQ